MQPIVNGLEPEFEDQIAFQHVDANSEAGRRAMSAYGLRGHPSYAIVDVDGSVRWTAAGQLPAEQLRQALIAHSTLVVMMVIVPFTQTDWPQERTQTP
jgi:hypothetical protein